MAMLKYVGPYPSVVLGSLGEFTQGTVKEVPDETAKVMVITSPEIWQIEAPEAERTKRRQQFAEDRKLDTKQEEGHE